jgi:tRNA threonylcarbamoyl adenosine modification protein (Sua5/YciO/YrdC/YwlC family)
MTTTEEEIDRAAAAALRGELVILPTDTIYGIGTRPDDPAATARLFAAKRRPRDLELPVLIPNLVAGVRVARFGAPAKKLVERFWPGGLTLVLERTPLSADWDLGGNPASIGLRIPADPVARALLGRTGPLAVTSANLSGSPTPSSCREVEALFGDLVALTLCADGELTGNPSTVLDCTTDPPSLLRPGAISEQELRAMTDLAE